MASSSNQKTDIAGILALFFFLFQAVVVWFWPLACVFSIICWLILWKTKYNRANQIIRIIIYIIAIFTLVCYFFAIEPIQSFMIQRFTIYGKNFNLQQLVIDGHYQNIIIIFKNYKFYIALTYFIVPTVMVTSVNISFLFFVSFLATRKNAKKRLLKKRPEPKANFKKFDDDLERVSKYFVPLGVNLSTDGKSTAGVPHNMLSKHVCLIGTTGSGKTNTLYHFIRNALYNGKPMVYIDGKGDLANIERFKKLTKNAEIITMDGKKGYNPLSSGTPTELTDKIISMYDWSDDHYKQNSSRFFQLVLSYITLFKIDRNLVNVVKYCDLNELKNHFMTYKQLAPDCGSAPGQIDLVPDPNVGQAFSLSSIGKNAPSVSQTPDMSVLEREAGEIIRTLETIDTKSFSGLLGRLGSLVEGDLKPLFTNKDGIDLNKIIENNQSVLFSLDSLRYPAQSNLLGKLIVNDIKTCVSAHQRRGGGPVSLFFDEFNVFASHEVVDVINKSRSAGFEAVISFQSLSDIDKIKDNGEALRRQIIQNCNTLICQLQNDSHDAEELSSLFGTFENVQETLRVDERGDFMGEGSLRKVREFYVHPDEIKNLRVGQAFFKMSGLGQGKIQIANLD